METENKYYVKLVGDFSNWYRDKSIVGVIKHEKYGYVYPCDDIEEILKTKTVKLNVWPDNDRHNFWNNFEVGKIFIETTTYKELEL